VFTFRDPSIDTFAQVIVQTSGGKVSGIKEGEISCFLGIPYAAAPFGANRFKAPVPASWGDDVLNAATFRATAPQIPVPDPFSRLIYEPIIPGEECLNLNIWTPDVGGSGLPVLVWIHGGAFRTGSNAVPTYDGSAFARDGVVFVSINYRLGVEGFADLPGAPPNRGRPWRNNGTRSPGNASDQRRASGTGRSAAPRAGLGRCAVGFGARGRGRRGWLG